MNRNKIAAIFLTLAFILAGGMIGQTLSPIEKAHAHFAVCPQIPESASAVPCANVSKFFVVPLSLTPTATPAAVGVSNKTFTVTGLDSTYFVIAVHFFPTMGTTLCPVINGRVTAANTLTLSFANLTAAACTPDAGTYFVWFGTFN